MKLKLSLLSLGVIILLFAMIQQPPNKLLATKLKMNNYPECPPQSENINVLLTGNNSPTQNNIVRQIPFDEGTIQYTEQVPNAQGTPVAQVVTYDNYLRGVLAGEVGIANYFDDEVLKSMAVVARTKSYHHCGTDMQAPQGNGVRGQILQQYSYNHIFNFDEAEQTRYQNAVDYGTNPYLTHNNDTFPLSE